MLNAERNLLPLQDFTTWFVRYYRGIQQGSVATESQPMQAILLSREEVARRAKQLYESSIRQQVEVE